MRIEKRYQRFGPTGIVWTNWFKVKDVESSDEAEDVLNLLKKQKEPCKRLKNEFRLIC